jgi:hypothetical protein
VIKCFQVNRIFNQKNSPELAGENIEKLILELVTLPLEEQNQVWHSLNASYLPSVLYRVRVVSFIDDESIQLVGDPLSGIQLKINERGGE